MVMGSAHRKGDMLISDHPHQRSRELNGLATYRYPTCQLRYRIMMEDLWSFFSQKPYGSHAKPALFSKQSKLSRILRMVWADHRARPRLPSAVAAWFRSQKDALSNQTHTHCARDINDKGKNLGLSIKHHHNLPGSYSCYERKSAGLIRLIMKHGWMTWCRMWWT